MPPRYEVLEVLGSGACAHVVRARRLRDGPGTDEVALKVLRAEMVNDAAVTRRFRDEGRILARLHHPYVVEVHEMLDYDGRLVIEMELVVGGTLERVLSVIGPVPMLVILAVVRQAAEALMAAWDAPGADGRPMHIVHRDLKPANIGLSVDGQVRLLDFGYAKGDFEGRAAQSLHDVWGTIGYDAPERRAGHTTQAADVYALGVTVFVGLTTRPMLLSMKEAHHDEDLEGAVTHLKGGEGIGADALRDLVRDCMHFDPGRRLGLEQLVERLNALVPAAEADAALVDFARGEIREIWDGRMQVEPGQDAAYRELSFLDEQAPTPARTPLSADEGRAELEAVLAEPDWVGRVAELDLLVDACSELPTEPLVAVVERASVPFYKPWVKAAAPAEVEAALLLLRRVDRKLAATCGKSLLGHDDARVRAAGEFVSEG